MTIPVDKASSANLTISTEKNKDESAPKKDFKDIYQISAFDEKSRIARFGLNSLDDLLHAGSFDMYLRMPESLSSLSEVQGWLSQAGEDSGWIDVDIKYKLLQHARLWKESQQDNDHDHPPVTLGIANAQETYNLTVLAEQNRLRAEFTNPLDAMPNMNHL